MECSEFRQRIESDPASTDDQADQHARDCAACNAYARRVRAAERLICPALRFDVAEFNRQVAAQAQPAGRLRFRAMAGTAAALVVMVAIWALVRPNSGSGTLALDVAEHWQHEPYSWVVTDARVSDGDLQRVLKKAARLDLAKMGPITYASSCFFRGHWIPHLVVQGQAGPVMVLLMPDERLETPERVVIPEEGLSGVIVPHGRGSVALLGDSAEPMEPLERNLVEAVEWSI